MGRSGVDRVEMALGRTGLLLLVVTAAVVVAASPAPAKEGVEAAFTADIPLDAPPGTTLDVAWTLTFLDDDGRRRPFNAEGVFVRLLSTTNGPPETAFAQAGAHATGEYEATVVVPEGGIGAVQVGIRGGANGQPSDLLFPIAGDPSPEGTGPAAPLPGRPASEPPGAGAGAALAAAAAAAAFAVAVLALALARHRLRRRRPLPPPAGSSAGDVLGRSP
jgi:hypothetical protein